MRELKLQMQISIDGFVSGPNGEMDWVTWDWDEALNHYVTDLTGPVDTIILGRKLAEGFIPYWTSELEKGAAGEDGAEKMVNTDKIVFTRTLETSAWDRTELAKGNLVDEIRNLKELEGGDIIVYGGANFVSSLIKERLIDTLYLFVNPVAIGNGLPIFRDLESNQNMTLSESRVFPCGIVVLCYQPKD